MRSDVRRGGPLERLLIATVPVLVATSFGACTLEQRFDPELESVEVVGDDTLDVEGVEAPGLPGPPSVTPEEAVTTTLEVFREAVRVGDLSLALSLFHRDALLIDDLATGVSPQATRGETLIDVRRRYAEGLRLRSEVLEVREIEGSFLVSSRSVVVDAEGDPGPEGERSYLQESALLVPSAEGWRIALFHRSAPSTLQNPGT
ncbi:MAG: hypothetical protein EA351_09090 [Gemmatimonadales bacterium]|nr:MAG: hypothetical protein EA351_09090 [Gemmatimonadales bacterium]